MDRMCAGCTVPALAGTERCCKAEGAYEELGSASLAGTRGKMAPAVGGAGRSTCPDTWSRWQPKSRKVMWQYCPIPPPAGTQPDLVPDLWQSPPAGRHTIVVALLEHALQVHVLARQVVIPASSTLVLHVRGACCRCCLARACLQMTWLRHEAHKAAQWLRLKSSCLSLVLFRKSSAVLGLGSLLPRLLVTPAPTDAGTTTTNPHKNSPKRM
jgi:hypothetical protein